MANSNAATYLQTAATLYRGDLAQSKEAADAARDLRNSSQWEIMCNLVAYAMVSVFKDGYKKTAAAMFREEVKDSFAISAKQAGKYTEAISAALGVRGMRDGIKPLKGLGVAALEGLDQIKTYLNASGIDTFNKFMQATRVDKDPVVELARKFAQFTTEERADCLEHVKVLDKRQAERDKDREAAEGKRARKATKAALANQPASAPTTATLLSGQVVPVIPSNA